MIKVYPSNVRGFKDKGWLKTYHTFSFDTHYNSDLMHYQTLRVLNEDIVEGGGGFPEHWHQEMEILTYVIEGALEHKDSMGNVSAISEGQVQKMSAGSGILHSERNLSASLPVHFFQIWFLPEQHHLEPSYEKRSFSSAAKWGQWCLLASSNGRNGSLRLHQDADVYTILLEGGDGVSFEALLERYYWAQVVSGEFFVQNKLLVQGDGAALQEETLIDVRCQKGGELLLMDLRGVVASD